MPFQFPRLLALSSTELRFMRKMLLDIGRRVLPAPHRPNPASWPDDALTVAWLGHSTVLLNFFGLHILTDPALFSRTGLGLGPFVIGPKRYIAPALTFKELPRIDLLLLSHAHMDHFDLPTLSRFRRGPKVVTATKTSDLLRRTRLRRDITELGWGEQARLEFGPAGAVEIEAFEVRHWGARLRTDDYRGYNGYILRRHGHAILFAGDTAFTPLFGQLRERGPFDLAIFPIGAYDPWIRAHCTPEEAVAMADLAGARTILPVHQQTFQLSYEPMDEPMRRLEQALAKSPQRIGWRTIGETFRLQN